MSLRSVLRGWKHWLFPGLPVDYRDCVKEAPLRGREEIRRCGTDYGGSWLPVALRLPGKPVIYAAGAGEDLSFEVALASEFDCDLRVIDPTPRAGRHFQGLAEATAAGLPFLVNGNPESPYRVTPAEMARMRFHALGVAGSDGEQRFYFPQKPTHVSCAIGEGKGDYFTARCLTLPSLLRELGHDHIDLLKLDIEGAEYGALEGLAPGPSLPRYLCVGFHVRDAGDARRLRRTHRRLKRLGYRFAYAEGFDALFEREDAA